MRATAATSDRIEPMAHLTVVIPTFNRAPVLRVTLEAMSRVRLENRSVEILVIDNACTDDTPAVLRQFSDRLPIRWSRERVPGKSNALNHALRDSALGDIVVFTDDDVTPDLSWFETIMATCQRWPTHSVFGGRIDPAWPSAVPKPFWAADKTIQSIAFSAHHVSDQEGPYPERLEPFGPNFWVRRSALAGVAFRTDLGPHPTRRTLGDESEFLRQLRRRGCTPIYSPSARVVHRIEPERTTEAAIYRRVFQSGRGTVYVSGMPDAALLKKSKAAWRLRVASNVGIAAWQLVAAALEPDEKLRFTRLYNRTYTFSKNLEALRWTVRAALGRAPADSVG